MVQIRPSQVFDSCGSYWNSILNKGAYELISNRCEIVIDENTMGNPSDHQLSALLDEISDQSYSRYEDVLVESQHPHHQTTLHDGYSHIQDRLVNDCSYYVFR